MGILPTIPNFKKSLDCLEWFGLVQTFHTFISVADDTEKNIRLDLVLSKSFLIFVLLKYNSMIQLIKSNGEVTDNFTADTLKEKQDAVGGYIEVVATRKGKVLIVNEEGIWKGLKKNEKASEIAEFTIFGDVICLDEKDYHNFLN